MTNPLEYIRQHPKLAKQLIGLNLPELENLIKLDPLLFGSSLVGVVQVGQNSDELDFWE